ncbi:uncharacterized protein E0L32_004642 [Thyridium curvatum]|uniref:Protoheme IX farnesyltransferase, mitochondrial n=1 Tax=Thyridium curvatum TaxID=1093900 RepID=A0A507AX59_9PEZI|nr:uncharacterized protein E0L32_004642 [Thyridium curvatum]TPX15365.1 hypothetical protein E0L32_004642 [Thyridium curvatum]
MRPAGLSMRALNGRVCSQCGKRPVLPRLGSARRPADTGSSGSFFSTAPASGQAVAAATTASRRLNSGYFLSNTIFERFSILHRSTRPVATSTNVGSPSTEAASAKASNVSGQDASARSAGAASSSSPYIDQDLPHRRRQAARRKAAAEAAAAAAIDAGSPSDLPSNASSTLTTVAERERPDSLKRYLSAVLSLSKPRLTTLVVLTAMAPYALYPVPAFLSSSLLNEVAAATPSLSPLTLLFLTTGTTLCSASANAFNMIYEPDTDSKMSRTRNRPLVRNIISKRAAIIFAIACGASGIAALQFGVNPTVAFLGLANIVLYAGVYTPMKRLHWLNTWVGAVVGGIPPLMGWAAAAGESATGDGSFRELLFASDGSSIGGWILAGLLYAWQFPHFMALSWSIREEYKKAGLKMLCWVNPARNGRVALRYSFIFLPLCLGLCAVGVTEWSFAVTTLPVNAWLLRESYRFWKLQGHGGSARGLFWASVWHLPAILVLALVQKKGMWQRAWRSVMGEPDPIDEDEWEDVEEDDVLALVPPPAASR